MVVNKDKDNEAEYTATISGTTITFNVPYSLLNTEIAGAEFTFAKTSQTALDPVDKGNLKDGGSVAPLTMPLPAPTRSFTTVLPLRLARPSPTLR